MAIISEEHHAKVLASISVQASLLANNTTSQQYN